MLPSLFRGDGGPGPALIRRRPLATRLYGLLFLVLWHLIGLWTPFPPLARTDSKALDMGWLHHATGSLLSSRRGIVGTAFRYPGRAGVPKQDWLCISHGHCPLPRVGRRPRQQTIPRISSFTTDDQMHLVFDVGDHGFGRAPAMISLSPLLIMTYFVSGHFLLVVLALDVLALGSACEEG
jgi:hypothetical protein